MSIHEDACMYGFLQSGRTGVKQYRYELTVSDMQKAYCLICTPSNLHISMNNKTICITIGTVKIIAMQMAQRYCVIRKANVKNK
jgi:hypothetical protein